MGNAWELSNSEEKSAERVKVPETALHEVHAWTANGERDRWRLFKWLLDVFGHAYLETNVDLKLPIVSNWTTKPRLCRSDDVRTENLKWIPNACNLREPLPQIQTSRQNEGW